jgi:hypothetical protein
MNCLVSYRCCGGFGDNLQKGEALKCFGTGFVVSMDETVNTLIIRQTDRQTETKRYLPN